MEANTGYFPGGKLEIEPCWGLKETFQSKRCISRTRKDESEFNQDTGTGGTSWGRQSLVKPAGEKALPKGSGPVN